jgi:hypothetical protein
MVHVDPQTGAVYLNAATVPRVRASKGSRTGASLHHFLLVQLQQQAEAAAGAAARVDGDSTAAAAESNGTYVVQQVDEVWVEVEPLGKGAAAAAAAAAASSSSSSRQGEGTGGGAATQQHESSSAGCRVAEGKLRVRAVLGDRGVVVMVWQANKQQLVPVILSEQAAARYSRAEGEEGSVEEEPVLEQVAA